MTNPSGIDQGLLSAADDKGEKQVPRYKVISLRIVNGVIIVFSIPYQFYNAPFFYTAVYDLTGNIIFSVICTSVVTPFSFLQDTLRLYPAENVEWALQKKPSQIKYPIPTHILRVIAGLTYSLDATKDIIPFLIACNSYDKLKIAVYILGSAVVIPAYVFYCFVLYDDRLIKHCNRFTDFISGIKRELQKNPAITLETAVMLAALGLNKFVSAGATLIQFWSGSPTVLVYGMMSKTAAINLLTRSLATIRLHHHPNYQALTDEDFSRIKLGKWEKFRIFMLAALRGTSAGMVIHLLSESFYISIPVSAILFVHKAYVGYKIDCFQKAFAKKTARLASSDVSSMADDKEQTFQYIIQHYDTTSLNIMVSIQNGIVNLMQLGIVYGMGSLVLTYFNYNPAGMLLGFASLLLTAPLVEINSNIIAEDVRKTVKSLRAKNLIAQQIESRSESQSSILSRWFGIFCCRSKTKLVLEANDTDLQSCLNSLPQRSVITPMTEIKTAASPVQPQESRNRVASFSTTAAGIYQTFAPPPTPVIPQPKLNNNSSSRSCFQCTIF